LVQHKFGTLFDIIIGNRSKYDEASCQQNKRKRERPSK
jgi:hypothetical protein